MSNPIQHISTSICINCGYSPVYTGRCNCQSINKAQLGIAQNLYANDGFVSHLPIQSPPQRLFGYDPPQHADNQSPSYIDLPLASTIQSNSIIPAYSTTMASSLPDSRPDSTLEQLKRRTAFISTTVLFTSYLIYKHWAFVKLIASGNVSEGLSTLFPSSGGSGDDDDDDDKSSNDDISGEHDDHHDHNGIPTP